MPAPRGFSLTILKFSSSTRLRMVRSASPSRGHEAKAVDAVDVGLHVDEFVVDIAGGEVDGVRRPLGFPEPKDLGGVEHRFLELRRLNADVPHGTDQSPRHPCLLFLARFFTLSIFCM